jgi:hypothetical protein
MLMSLYTQYMCNVCELGTREGLVGTCRVPEGEATGTGPSPVATRVSDLSVPLVPLKKKKKEKEK